MTGDAKIKLDVTGFLLQSKVDIKFFYYVLKQVSEVGEFVKFIVI